MKRMNDQQKQALGFFNRHAPSWERKASGSGVKAVNVVKQRNDYVVSVAERRRATRRALDVGCGTGELACSLGRMGVDARGVDFAANMIDIARRNARKAGASKVSFECASIFDYPLDEGSFDLISANGFIEYISYAELDRFLELARRALSRGGSLVLGSRN